MDKPKLLIPVKGFQVMKRWEQIEGIPAFYWLFSWGSLHQHQLRPRQPNSSSLWPRCTSSLEWCSSTHGLPDTHLQHPQCVIYSSAGAQPQTHLMGPGQGRGVGTALPVQGRRCWPGVLGPKCASQPFQLPGVGSDTRLVRH